MSLSIGLLVSGVSAGILLAAPLGPVGAFCLGVSLEHGARRGLLAGLGAAVGDAIFAALVMFGLAQVGVVVEAGAAWLRLLAGLFLLGVVVVRVRTPLKTRAVAGRRLSHFGGGLVLTLGNPAMLIPFATVLGAITGGTAELGPTAGAWVVAGVFVGALGWWTLLTTLAGRFRERLGRRGLARIEDVINALLGGCGVALVGVGAYPLLVSSVAVP